ncbi:MAG: YDG domain-containing protein [Selenomonadaceae bacterium]|nr:YDG domain-containing protein [Selenomonadaceae bacterium]
MRKERVARKERLALQVGIALTAGVFGAVPAAEGAPVVDKVVTAGTQVAQSGSITDVTGTQQNNIVKWTDFSVNQGETVRFDKGAQEKNYLNLVTGPKTSEIAGTIEGGKDVYLVNPHGVIFHQGAQVDVGNLYVSTENTDAALEAFNAGKTPGEVLTAGTANADVVNLGGIAASSVIVNGDTIRFLTDNVQAQDVTLQAAKSIVKEQTATHSASTGVLRAAALAAKPSYVLRAPSVSNKTAITKATEFAAMNQNLSGDYSLEADLTLSGTYTPIGGNGYGAFTGTFDGNFHTISGIQVSGGTYGGLFGLTSGATIQNVGVKSGSVTAVHAGGIVGKAVSTTLTDVYNAGVSVNSQFDRNIEYSRFSAGGIVGYAENSKIKQAYNTATISGYGAGIVGSVVNGTEVKDVYNTGAVSRAFISYAATGDTSNISCAYTTQGLLLSTLYGGKADTNTIFSVTSADTSSTKYSGFDISSSGSDNTVWRIYEGHSLPLLRDFLRRGKGTVTVSYDYAQGSNKGTINGSDLTLTYNNQDVKLSNINYTNANGLAIDASKIMQDTGSLRNANVYDGNGDGKIDVTPDKNNKVFDSNGQQAFYCTSQDGYDLVGNNVYINQREVNISSDSVADKHITKVYDGKVDASDAVKALFNASDTSVTGLIAGDTTASLTTNDLKASFDDKNVGVGKKVTANGTLTLSQKAHNYKVTGSGTAQLNNVTLFGDITPAKLTLSLADGKTLTKVYEGKANAATAETVSSLLSSDKTVTGLQKDDKGKIDVVTLGFRDGAAKGTYGTKNADGTFTKDGSAGAHDVELAGIQLSGKDAGNYNLIDASGNIIWGEKYTAGADANANGTLKAVGKTSGGTAYLKGTITRRNLTADGFTWYDGSTPHAVADNTKEYDTTSVYKDANGKRVNKADGSATGLVTGDSVAFTVNGSGTHFVRATVADGKVTVSNDDAKTVEDANAIAYAVTVSGEDARNYTLNGSDIQDGGTATVYGEGKITPRTLLVGAADGKVFEKTYDGDKTIKTSDGRGTATNPFTLADGYLAYTGDVNHQLLNDGATITYTGTYSDPNVARDATSGKATTKDVTFTAQVKDANGQPSQNYVFQRDGNVNTTMEFVGKGIINPAKITAVTFEDVHKPYDSTSKNSSITMTGATGLVNGESFSDILQAGTDSQYVVKNGGTYQVTPHVDATNASYTVSLQNPKGNYDLALPQDANGNYLAYGKGTITPLTITKITLNPKANTPITKVYDGNNDVTHKEENGQTVEAQSYVTTLEAEIPNSTNKLTFTQDAASLGYTVAGASFAEKNSHNGQTQNVTYYLNVKGPDGFDDYKFDDSLLDQGRVKAAYAPQGVITPREVKPVVKGSVTKVFDGTTAVVGADGTKLSGNQLVDLQGILAADQGSVTNGTTAVYQNANVNRAGNYEDGKGFVQYTYQLDGDANGNYHLTQTSGTGDGTITPRHLTAEFSSVHKTYDGNTTLVGTVDNQGLPTIKPKNLADKDTNKDQIGVSYRGVYASPDVTDDNYVKYTDVALTNNDDGNYILDLSYLPNEAVKTVRGEGKITSAQVTKNDIVTLFAPITKIYDGNTNVAYDHTSDAAYDADYQASDARSKTAADFLQDGDAAASGTQSIRIKGRALTYGKDYTIAAADGATYDGENAGNHNVTYRFQLSDTVRRNYDFSKVLKDRDVFSGTDLLGKTQGTITQKTVTAALSGITDIIEKKTYDGKTTLPDGTDVTNRVTFRGLLDGDAQLGKVTGVYDTKDVARNADGTVGTKDVLYTPSLDGTGAANYQLKLVSPEGAALTGTTLTGAGQGRIQPKTLGFTAGYTEKTYDATADAEVIAPEFTGLVEGKKSLKPGTADGKTLVKAQYGIYDGTTFTPDENVEGDEKDKAIAYQNLQQALAHAAGQTDTIKASNYTIADTVYFDQAKQKGKIKRLALSAGDIKERWSGNIQKQYDGTTAVDLTDPEKNFQIYIDETTANGTKLKLPKTVYLHYELDASKGSAQYNSKDVKNADAVTYHISGLKNSEKLANNFTFSDGGSLDLEKYKGDFTLKNGKTSGSGILVGDGSQKAVVGITKRVLRVHADGHNDKTYDGNAAADAGHLVLADGTDRKSAQDIANILQNDKTDLASHVVANYMATGGAQETAAAANVGAKHDASQGEGGKVVAYTVDLAAGKDLTANYALDTSQAAADGVTNQVKDKGTEQQGTYIGHGDILRRVVYVSFADPKAENRKEYDGTPTVTDKADDLIRKFALSDEDAANKTGIIRDDMGRVRVTGATGTYDTAHVKRDAKSGKVLDGKHTVTYSGFTLKNADGSDNTNYELAAADGRTDEQGHAVLVGKGTITPATLHVSLKDANVTKVYDATRDVKDATYGLANVVKRESDLKTGEHNVRDAVHITLLDGTPQYDNKNANVVKGQKTKNRSVTYELGWDNTDYELALAQDAPSQTLDVEREVSATGVGRARLVTNAATITPKTVTAALSGVKDTIEKTYDGNATLPTADLKNRVTFTGLYDEDQQLAKVAGVYDTKDVAWNADGTVGTKNILYTPKLEGTGAANYELALVTPDGKTLTGATLTGEGQGRITPRQLTITAGYAEKIYDGTADAEVIHPRFDGLARGEERLTPGTALDGKSLIQAQYGRYDEQTFTPDADVEGDEAYKAVAYTNLKQALQDAAGQSDIIKASNYTIADTVYFDQAKQQGKIKRLALTARDIKQRWGSDIQKQYDGTQAIDVKDPKAYLTLYITGGTGADGRNVALPQTLTLDYDLDGAQYNSADVRNADAVTYHINGVKNGANITNNFRFDDGVTQDLTKYQGDFTLKNGEVSDIARGVTVGDGRETAVVAIKKRVLNGRVTSGHNDKIYNGETAADSSFLVLTDGTDGKSAAEIEAMLQKDDTTFGDLIQANYIDAQGHADAGASTRAADHDATRPGTKQVRYTVSLTDALKDNYAVDKDDTTKTETSYDGFGDIFKRVVYVDFADDKEDTKTYDGYDDVKKPLRTFALSDEQGDMGIIKADQGKVHLDTGNITGKYASAHVKRAADGTPAAQQVSYRGFGVDNANYEARAKAADGADSDTLVGMGTITPAALHVGLRDANVTQAYDNTLDVEDLARYGEANVQLADGDLKTVNNVRDTVNVKLSGTPQYDKKDANVIQGRKTENRSVTYELTWDNPDYELAVAQDVPSQTLDVTEEISSGGVGTARLVTDAALITPRTVTLAADPAKTATRLYDGASGGAAEHAIGNLEAGNLAKGEKLINLFLAPGATEESYLPETVLRSAYDSDPNAGRDGVAVAGDRNDLRAHTVTYTYTLQNPNYQFDATGRTVGTASGQGVIRRRDVTVTADPVTMAMGHALPVFTGGTSGFIAEDAAVQTSFESGLQFRPEDSVIAPSVGTYGVYGWYRTREEQEVTVPAVLDQDGKTVVTPAHTEKQLVDVWHREGNLGLNYYFQQDAGNDTALTVTRPTADWPRSLEEAFRPAQQYVPDGNAYHRVSYDTHQETNRTPTVGIEYAAGGLNVGAAGAAAAALEGGRDVVNLGGTRAAVVDVTYPGAAEFVVSGERAVPGVTEAAWTKLAASEARGAAAALGGGEER